MLLVLHQSGDAGGVLELLGQCAGGLRGSGDGGSQSAHLGLLCGVGSSRFTRCSYLLAEGAQIALGCIEFAQRIA
ncbi:hypothetical protein [Stenotrophomonas indicatrix]|uniref:hypothetical protein n=1 Tax=Stenotrophomonas indicatrix TaxID=2045451 RepID=UPI001CC16730|nr:hypothetical protein [Stenotrophomonas indicatrix]